MNATRVLKVFTTLATQRKISLEGGCGNGVAKSLQWLVRLKKKTSIGESRYFVTLLGKYSCYSFVRFVNPKHETANVLIDMWESLRELSTDESRVLHWWNGTLYARKGQMEEDNIVVPILQPGWNKRGIKHDATTSYGPKLSRAA